MRRQLAAALSVAVLCGCPAPPAPIEDAGTSQWRSQLYPEDWRPDRAPDEAGRFLHDFSYAGYQRGEREVPELLPGFGVALDPATDSTSAIQGAIDTAADAGGGVVLLPAGEFRVDGRLYVRSSNLEIRGLGASVTRLRFTSSAGMSDEEHLSFRGAGTAGAEYPLVADAPTRATFLLVADAGTLAPGDLVAIGFVITPAFIEQHGMTGTWTAFNGQWRPFARREVVSVDRSGSPHRVTVDIPLRYPALLRDGASIRSEPGRLRNVGLRWVGLSNAVSWSEAWAVNRSHVVGFRDVTDGWVLDVETFGAPGASGFTLEDAGVIEWHTQSGGLYLLDSSRVTVARSRFGRAQNRGSGGNGYLVELSRTSDSLIQDVVAQDGRHNFIQNWDFGTSGNVFHRCHTAGGRNVSLYFSPQRPVELPAPSEFHHSLAMANLIDSCVIDDGWNAVNRHSQSSGAGHTSTENVFWNVRGEGTLNSQQFGHGYVIGTDGLAVEYRISSDDPDRSAPRDWAEGLDAGASLEPRSLYEDQLRRRLGR